MPLTRETNSEELEIVAKQLSVVLTQIGEAPTVAFTELLERIEKENTEAEIGISELASATALQREFVAHGRTCVRNGNQPVPAGSPKGRA